MINWRKNVVTKKAIRYGMALPRCLVNARSTSRDYENCPPVIANSIPKSGTHLLIQILQTLPQIRDWGLFLATMPSIPFRRIPDRKLSLKISRLAPGELAAAHLFYSQEIAESILQRKAVHFFIYRDPRDVAVSEAYYLSEMNPFHRLSKYFRAKPSLQERISLSLWGTDAYSIPFDFPNLRKRFERYLPWIQHPDVCACRFEDLISENRQPVIEQIIDFYVQRCRSDHNREDLVQAALHNIRPLDSHTFRKGESGSWQSQMTSEQKESCRNLLGPLLVKLGYESEPSQP